MPKLSTFQLILLVVFGSLGAAGVITFALFTASGSSSSVGPVTIWGTLDAVAVNTALRELAETDGRLNEVSYEQKDLANYDAEIKNALASGRGPDIFIMRQDHAVRDASYSLHIPYSQLSESQFQSTFLEAATPFLGIDGVVAVPFAVDPLVLFWNRDALATAGITSPPQYWDQLPGMVESLVKKNESGTVEKGGVALGEYVNINSAKDILVTLILQAGGSLTIRDNGVLRSALVSQGGAARSATALTFYTEFADSSQPDYSWSKAFPEARQAFAAGDVAMYLGHASDGIGIRALNPNLNFAMAALPQIRSATYALNTSNVYAFALARTSPNTRSALTVAYILAASDFSLPATRGLGMASALRRVVSPSPAQQSTSPAAGALQELVGDAHGTPESLVNYAANISRPWLDPDPDATNNLFRAMIENTVNGALKAPEAVQQADKQMSAILGL
jgi:ABC-type glycerol-3-phosphate transport system substrate-binding protein